MTTIALPKPHPAQLAVRSEARRYNVVNCGRRWGKTDMGVTMCTEEALAGKPAGWFRTELRPA
jgi:hypothetical protein